ncbi:MAG: rRNA cytosine-C5-methyltransferase, partial [Paludibacteraceae bacterium]|nr:rRNA cytosine-C5-methyltransferase [Paludibacteraceae bacterium]
MNLNPDFILLIQQQTGADAEKFFEALQEPQSTSVRINNKIEAADLEILSSSRPIPYCATGYSLPSRPDFTLDPMLHGGAYYVQEASSMYLESIISKYITGSVRCLDLCAAPGGKSTHLASLLSSDSLIISNEIMPQRANILAENMIKWGNGNTLVTNNKPSDFKKLGAIFDIIVADVPCSGEGMFRKEPQAVEQWSLD